MNERTPSSDSSSTRPESIADLESMLRTQSLVSRHTPSALLRPRTLSALRQHPQAESAFSIFGQRRAWTAAGLCFVAIVASTLAFLLPRHSDPIASTVAKHTQTSVGSRAVDGQITRISRPSPMLSASVSLKNPLLTEAKLLARDAQQTISTFQAVLPRTTRVAGVKNPPPRTSPGVNQANR